MAGLMDMLFAGGTNPDMGLPVDTSAPYTDNVQNQGFADMLPGLTGPEQQTLDTAPVGNTDTLSSRIQQLLGAKPQDQGGQIHDILAGRFQADPSFDDIGNSAIQTLQSGSYVPAQQYADKRMEDAMTKLALLARIQNGGSGGASSVFAQTMAAINADPQYAGMSTMDKIRLAQNKVGTNLTIGADGKVSDMSGAAAGLGNLAYGEKTGGETGTQQVKRAYEPGTAGLVQDSQNASNIRAAAPLAVQKEIGTATGQAEGAIVKKTVNAPTVLGLVAQAKEILPKASGGGISALGAGIKQFRGISDTSTQANSQLDVISAGLLNNVPRMEGPQSDADRMSYEKAAADVGNRSKPTGDRIAALQIVEGLQNKYAGIVKPSTASIPAQNAAQAPQGSVVIGTSGGKKVYQLPDGSHAMEQ